MLAFHLIATHGALIPKIKINHRVLMQSRQSRPLLFNALSASPSHQDLGSSNGKASDKYEQVVSEYNVSLNHQHQ